MRAPDDALMQVGDPQSVVLCIELKEQLIQTLGHVVDRPRIGRIKDFLRRDRALLRLDADRQIALRDCRADG